ncbi:xanthine dehydrogenase family protein molybdopterin-binding subunit [Vibrio fluvialis]|uniref:Xanthine dehydrogenase family protein molybdopterin-binding subunit n=1 Tax=Vibrio fluvialis TaxID=676 RepID=A0AAX2LW36_VIBFL|nr:xanthine dehydrogenase family protein molybdopterin-binding subunit [Vibrio fluvialis]AMF92525.1 xanthine dehydrogenase family protein molybdopterin-binding subunit [Vibrio fluvialis]EKO4009082.1 xanthine dehydrogenase family protein molybdopterin-binding subunit [Vibrio fluvialis]MBY8228356.1 xanthine dehydrogenase family protein molybdopterin-binding subunit [Vibrio fluvialis]MCE7632759.1 xanthine dehydrogenase family protein molybdopterin-binding subunit [Vibrio fluvialis]SUQ27377.1 Xant
MRRMSFSTVADEVVPGRRKFLKLMGGVGAGLTLGFSLPVSNQAQAADMTSSAVPFEPNAFVRIGSDNKVTVMIKHIEMGQGTYTGLTTLVAEELDADWAQMVAEGAPADASRYNNTFWGPMQGTGGSTAIANSYIQMRTAGAAAKAMLVAAAAQRWNVDASQIQVRAGIVSHGNKKATFGELALDAAKQPVPDEASVKLKTPEQFVFIGKRKVSRKDTGKNNGTAIFTQDIKLPGMLTAMVLHAPKFGAKVKTVDATQAKASPGVVDVVTIPTGVAVLAKDYWSAKKGRDLLSVTWDESQAFTKSSAQIMTEYKTLSQKEGLSARNEGDAVSALKQADSVIDNTYEFPFLSHSPMEPMNCVAQVSDQGCEIWNGEQFQTVDQMNIAQLLGLKPEQVTLHMLLAGGSFGRRANPHSDYLIETVEIARQKKGTPIKMVWSREDDTQVGYYRPAYVHHIQAGLDANGNISSWKQHIVGQSILTGTAFEAFAVKEGIDGTSVEGASNIPYAIPNLSIQLTTVKDGPTVQWWRSVGSTHTAFAVETMIDELAANAGKDPVEMRMQLLAKHPRWQGVLKLAAEKAGWGKTLPAGSGMGVAVHESFNTFVAQVAQVSVKNGQISVDKVVCAVDCGVAVNPDVIAAQMEGGIGFGLSPTLMSAITLGEGGMVEQSNFHNYQVLRMNQMPDVEVHIVPSAEAPSGVGEPGVPPIAPAVANAVAAATGQRLHTLPLKLATS